MGTSHGAARVRPDGKVNVTLALPEGIYRALFEWSRLWGLTMGEAVERLARNALNEEA